MNIDDKIGNNGWQNIGIMQQYARRNIEHKNRDIFLCLVEESFGYGNTKTLHRTQEYWAKSFGVSKNTFNTQVNELAAGGHIKINHQKGYVEGGGSVAYSYSPVFPKGVKIWIKNKNDNAKTTGGGETEVEWIQVELAQDISN